MTHPGHLDDVLKALEWLCIEKGMRRYMLVGHSAGATLALQVLRVLLGGEASRYRAGAPPGGIESLGPPPPPPPLPEAIFCLEGIYDLPALASEYPHYTSFISCAFGPPPSQPPPPTPPPHPWTNASPSSRLHQSIYKAYLQSGIIHLFHSDQDELLSLSQLKLMDKCLTEAMGGNVAGKVVTMSEMCGGHDEVLGNRRVFGVVERAVREVEEVWRGRKWRV